MTDDRVTANACPQWVYWLYHAFYLSCGIAATWYVFNTSGVPSVSLYWIVAAVAIGRGADLFSTVLGFRDVGGRYLSETAPIIGPRPEEGLLRDLIIMQFGAWSLIALAVWHFWPPVGWAVAFTICVTGCAVSVSNNWRSLTTTLGVNLHSAIRRARLLLPVEFPAFCDPGLRDAALEAVRQGDFETGVKLWDRAHQAAREYHEAMTVRSFSRAVEWLAPLTSVALSAILALIAAHSITPAALGIHATGEWTAVLVGGCVILCSLPGIRWVGIPALAYVWFTGKDMCSSVAGDILHAVDWSEPWTWPLIMVGAAAAIDIIIMLLARAYGPFTNTGED
ncbi:MAG: hypothetical protein R6V19_13750 [Armatimonadota bacterium]